MRVDIFNTLLVGRIYREQLDLEPILIVTRLRQAGETGDACISSNISPHGPVSLPIALNASTTTSVLNTAKTPCLGTSVSCIPSDSL